VSTSYFARILGWARRLAEWLAGRADPANARADRVIDRISVGIGPTITEQVTVTPEAVFAPNHIYIDVSPQDFQDLQRQKAQLEVTFGLQATAAAARAGAIDTVRAVIRKAPAQRRLRPGVPLLTTAFVPGGEAPLAGDRTRTVPRKRS